MNGMVIGDLHVGLVYKGISFNSRIVNCISQAIKHIEQHPEIEMLVVLGDILHNARLSLDAIHMVIFIVEKLCSHGIPIYILEGNHDKKCFGHDSRVAFDILQSVEFRNDNAKFIQGIWFRQDAYARTTFLFIPYFTKQNVPEQYQHDIQAYLDAQTKQVLKELESKYPSNSIIAFTHLAVKGADSSSDIEWLTLNDICIPDCLLKHKKVKYIFNGHIHLPQTVGKVIMPGSIETFRFGEGHKRYFVEFET